MTARIIEVTAFIVTEHLSCKWALSALQAVSDTHGKEAQLVLSKNTGIITVRESYGQTSLQGELSTATTVASALAV